jgi:ferredoxin
MKEYRMKVWIDQDECMGAGTCEQIAPLVFESRTDGVWVVREDADLFGSATIFDGKDGETHGPAGAAGVARVPESLTDWVIEAAEECPSECIYVVV